MFYTEKKFQRRIEELRQKRYFAHQNITPFASMEEQNNADESHLRIPERIAGEEFALHDMFVGRDRYLWLEKRIVFPKAKEGCEIVGLFDFGETGHGNNCGFESILYLDGQPYQGVDTNHREVVFTDMTEKEATLSFMLWTGLEGGGVRRNFYHQCKQADIAYLHRKTDEFYYYTCVIQETLEYMDRNSNEYYDYLVTSLDRAFLAIDWDGDDFYDTIEKAYTILMSELNKRTKKTDITVNVVGHTHIDVAWLWRLKHTKEKAQRSFATVLRLMEQYEEYTFLQSQPQLYQYMKEECPDLYAKMKERMMEGRWEADGGMWVEADCNLSSGEALVRQFLHGTRFFEKEFGKRCEYLWLPDVFGYSWALPQILKQCEIDTFMTTKISWNQFNSIPNDLFKWRGIDGTEILTYFIETPEVGHSFRDRFSTYNGYVTPRTAIGSWAKFKDKALSSDVLISYGFGDGGGGVNRDMLEYCRAMDKLPGLPNIKQTKAGDFFRKMHRNVNNTDRYVHTWDGELYLEYHRGTYTTQGYNKRMNRYLEHKLVQMEWLSAMAYILGGEYAAQPLHDAWECVLLHQFHDIIPGSSIREVYEDSHVNYAKAEAQADEAREKAFDTLIRERDHTYTVYSTNSFGGKELVLFPETAEGMFVDEDDNALEAQKCEHGYEVLIDVKSFAGVAVTFCPNEVGDAPSCMEIKTSESPFELEENVLETPYYTIAWNENGQLTKIYDKEAKRNVLREGQEGNVFEIYEDKPMDNDAWDIDIYYVEKMQKINSCGKPALMEIGPLKAIVRFVYNYHLSTFTQDMIVYKHSKRIDFKTHADWHETHKLLKVAFYTDIRSTKATYDIQFGHVERPTHWNNSWDWARFEVCGHKWADISETGYGVSLLNDCKYGHSIKDHAMKLSLLRSPKAPDIEADMGEHDFTYSLYPHIGTVTEGGTIEEANRLNLAAQVVKGVFIDARRLVKVSSDSVIMDAVKKAEDEECLIVRMHECRGGRSHVTLSSEYPVKQFVPCNLLEHDCGELIEGSSIDFEMKPFEIKTYKLFF